MSTIAEQFANFKASATKDGYPSGKDGCLELAFFAGFMTGYKHTTEAHTLSDLEAERDFSAITAELRQMFTQEHIRTFYEKQGRVKA